MNQQLVQNPSWYKAVTMAERVASLRSTVAVGHRGVNAELAARRLQDWQSQSPFTQAAIFAQRLRLDGVSEKEFFDLLGESSEALHRRLSAPPDWLQQLADAFSQPELVEPGAAPPPESLRGRELLGFLSVAAPLIRRGRRRVRDGLQKLNGEHDTSPFDPLTFEELLAADLPRQLVSMLSRTLTLEMHVARLQGMLEGETPEERFSSYLNRLRQPEVALALLEEYPALARHLTICIDNWVKVSLEFAGRLCSDWQLVRDVFAGGTEPGVLVHVEGGMGDTHRGGRSVIVATFNSGLKVVYKPRPLAVDECFQHLLAWMNERGSHPPFATLKVIDRGPYGWSEFVAATGCDSATGVRRFYERQGGYLALLYALEATDFHYGNLIAAGEHPMLIDLESLFHPRVEPSEGAEASLRVFEPYLYSVLRVGLLPQRAWGNADNDGIDISGLGGREGQTLPHSVPFWDKVGTDEMRLARRRMVLPGERNRPTLRGAEVNVLDYCDAILEGFEAVYRLLLEHRDELLADHGPLARFAGAEVRAIIRPTKSYAMLLHESFHPDLLRNGLERERYFDRLWIGIEHRPQLARVIASERRDLLHGDVPLFTTRPDSRDIVTSAGEVIEDFFGETGAELVRRRLQSLSYADLERQTWFTRASLATLAMATDGARWPSPRHVREPHRAADDGRLLDAAKAVGDRLETLALRGGGDVTWLGLTLIRERHWSLLPLSAGDLYNGLPGIALFLGYLGAVTGEGRYTELAHDVLGTVLRQVERVKQHITVIGGFEGWGGLIYTLTQLASALERPDLIAEAEEYVALLPPLIERDENLDIIGGAAGCLASLTALHAHRPSGRTLAAAVLCGERLLIRSRRMSRGVGWTTPLARTNPLTGFSHGAAGISSALLDLASLSGEERFRAAAVEGIDYERSLFSAENGNWPDLREFDTAGGQSSGDVSGHGSGQVASERRLYMTAWCHGAPGIGLGRLRSLRHLDDPRVRPEIEAALVCTIAKGFGGNHSLCHGDLGNIELLSQAGEALDDPRWREAASRKAADILESIKSNGWLCGIPLGVESPGLMTGLAGIGYGLLRLAEPRRVPSVLTLSPPAAEGDSVS